MKEGAYIDQERMEERLNTLLRERQQECKDDFDYDSQPSMFVPRRFPDHECKPIVRTRTRAEIAKLIEDSQFYL